MPAVWSGGVQPGNEILMLMEFCLSPLINLASSSASSSSKQQSSFLFFFGPKKVFNKLPRRGVPAPNIGFLSLRPPTFLQHFFYHNPFFKKKKISTQNSEEIVVREFLKTFFFKSVRQRRFLFDSVAKRGHFVAPLYTHKLTLFGSCSHKVCHQGFF